MMQGYEQKMKEKRREIVTLAWLTAALSRQKKLPRLESLLAETEKENRKKTAEEAKQEFIELLQRLGGEENEHAGELGSKDRG